MNWNRIPFTLKQFLNVAMLVQVLFTLDLELHLSCFRWKY